MKSIKFLLLIAAMLIAQTALPMSDAEYIKKYTTKFIKGTPKLILGSITTGKCATAGIFMYMFNTLYNNHNDLCTLNQKVTSLEEAVNKKTKHITDLENQVITLDNQVTLLNNCIHTSEKYQSRLHAETSERKATETRKSFFSWPNISLAFK